MSDENDILSQYLTPLDRIYYKAADDAEENVKKMFAASQKLHADAKAKDDAERLASGETLQPEDNDEKHDLKGLIGLKRTHLSLAQRKAKVAQVETLEGFIEVYLKHKAEWLVTKSSDFESAELMMAFGAIERALGINKSFARRVKKEDDGNPPLPSM